MASPRLEMLLYHGLDATGSIEISTTSDTGPWTKLTLTSTKNITDAMAEWTALAAIADFAIEHQTNGSQINVVANGVQVWVKLTPCLADLLGFDHQVIDGWGPESSNQMPLALVDTNVAGAASPTGLAIGLTFPVPVEEAELDEYRAARFATHHYGRADEVTIDIILNAATWALVRNSPMLSGHAAFYVEHDNADPFGESDFDGGLTLYPIETVTIEQDSPEDSVHIRLRCTVLEDGAQTELPGASTDSAWRIMAGALAYGYGVYYATKLRGIPTLFLEAAADAVAPTGYDLDATLVIDRSARLGSLADFDSPIAKGYDLELRLLTSAPVDAYMTRPQRVTFLTADLAAADTTVHVDSTAAFADMTEIYIGDSCIVLDPLGSVGPNAWGNVDRTAYGEARAYRKGALVTDSPSQWRDRRGDLYAVALDPSGRYVQTADVLDSAVMLWSGYIVERPTRDGTQWGFALRDQIRRLADPLGVAASGTAVWTDEDDALVVVPSAMSYAVKAACRSTSGIILDVQVMPFDDYGASDTERLSVLRTLVVDALTNAATDAQVTGFFWRKRPLDLHRNVWDLLVEFLPNAADTDFQVLVTFASNAGDLFVGLNFLGGETTPVRGAVSEVRTLGLMMPTRIIGAALAVVLDEGEASTLPTTGMVMITSGGKVDYVRYTALEIDPQDPGKVHLSLDPSERVFGQALDAIIGSEQAAVSVRFLWSDSGRLKDVLRRALVSTGDATHGAYDTLPSGQGLGLPMVDEDSFDDVFGGLFNDLNFQIYSDAGSKLADIFGGILQLSRTALATRRAADGTSVDIVAIDTGSVDTGVAVATVTEDMLVASQGRRPVRIKSAFEVPQVIATKIHSVPVDDQPAAEQALTFKDEHLTDWTRTKWDLDIYGIDRPTLLRVGRSWARSWFRSGETRQVVEIDVPPWIDAQPGQVVALELTDASLWDYANGVTGLIGLARVLGSQLSLTTMVQTLTVAADGITAAGPMCPALGIFAVNGGATTPTSIDVDDAYYDLIVAAKDEATPWYVTCYEDGQDIPARYTISTVTLPGGGVCRLTVTAYPSSPAVTLTTNFRLTWPPSSVSTDNQARYLHTDDGRQWS